MRLRYESDETIRLNDMLPFDEGARLVPACGSRSTWRSTLQYSSTCVSRITGLNGRTLADSIYLREAALLPKGMLSRTPQRMLDEGDRDRGRAKKRIRKKHLNAGNDVAKRLRMVQGHGAGAGGGTLGGDGWMLGTGPGSGISHERSKLARCRILTHS